MAEPLITRGRHKRLAVARERVDDRLESVEQPRTFGDRYPHELSGGQGQRASLAQAPALCPDLFTVPDPDEQARRREWERLRVDA